MTKAMVDTEIWNAAKKRPSREKFSSEKGFRKALAMHERARAFFEEEFPRLKVYMSLHQVAEVYHVLAFRGQRVPQSEALEFVSELLGDPRVVKVPVTLEHIRKAVEASAKTGIHIWDFLCFLPVAAFVDRVYTSDAHFLPIARIYGVEVVNPLAEWLQE